MACSKLESDLRRKLESLTQDMEVANRLIDLYKDQRDRVSTEKAELERIIAGLRRQIQTLHHVMLDKDAEIKRLTETRRDGREMVNRTEREPGPSGVPAYSGGGGGNCNEFANVNVKRIGPFSSTVLQPGRPSGSPDTMMSLPSPIRKQQMQRESEGDYQQDLVDDFANKENVLLTQSHDSNLKFNDEAEASHADKNESSETSDNIFSSTLQDPPNLELHVTTVADGDSTGWSEADKLDLFLLVKLRPELPASKAQTAALIPFGGCPANLNLNLDAHPTSSGVHDSSKEGEETEDSAPSNDHQEVANVVPNKRSRSTAQVSNRGGRGGRHKGNRNKRGRGGANSGRPTPTINALSVENLFTYFVAHALAIKYDNSDVRQNNVYRVRYYRKMVASTPAVNYGGYSRKNVALKGGRRPDLLYFVPYENGTIYEVDEEAIETKLPPPQYQRRGHVTFNFSFESYRLG